MEGREIIGMARSLVMFLPMGIRVLKKNNLDLRGLMEVPEAAEKSVNMEIKEAASLMDGRPMRRVSSTNCWCVLGGGQRHGA